MAIQGEDSRMLALETNLIQACTDGDLDCVCELLSKGANVNADLYKKSMFYASENYLTPLMCASRHGHVAVAKELLQRGADIEAADKNEMTAIHMAAENGRLEILRLLLDSGADCNVASKYPRKQCSDSSPYMGGTTPLHLAANGNYKSCIKELIINGADYNLVDESNRTSLYLAAAAGFEESILAHLDNAVGKDILSIPVKGTNETPLHECVRHGLRKCVFRLLCLGSDVNHNNVAGMTPFQIALNYRQPKFSLDIVRDIIVYGYNSDVDFLDKHLNSPLFYVAFDDNFKTRDCLARRMLGSLLIAYGASLDIKNKNGHNVLEAEIANLARSPDGDPILLQSIVNSSSHLPSLCEMELSPSSPSRGMRTFLRQEVLLRRRRDRAGRWALDFVGREEEEMQGNRQPQALGSIDVHQFPMGGQHVAGVVRDVGFEMVSDDDDNGIEVDRERPELNQLRSEFPQQQRLRPQIRERLGRSVNTLQAPHRCNINEGNPIEQDPPQQILLTDASVEGQLHQVQNVFPANGNQEASQSNQSLTVQDSFQPMPEREDSIGVIVPEFFMHSPTLWGQNAQQDNAPSNQILSVPVSLSVQSNTVALGLNTSRPALPFTNSHSTEPLQTDSCDRIRVTVGIQAPSNSVSDEATIARNPASQISSINANVNVASNPNGPQNPRLRHSRIQGTRSASSLSPWQRRVAIMRNAWEANPSQPPQSYLDPYRHLSSDIQNTRPQNSPAISAALFGIVDDSRESGSSDPANPILASNNVVDPRPDTNNSTNFALRWYDEVTHQPPSLQHVARICVRNSMGPKRLKRVPEMGIPTQLKRFILLDCPFALQSDDKDGVVNFDNQLSQALPISLENKAVENTEGDSNDNQ